MLQAAKNGNNSDPVGNFSVMFFQSKQSLTVLSWKVLKRVSERRLA